MKDSDIIKNITDNIISRLNLKLSKGNYDYGNLTLSGGIPGVIMMLSELADFDSVSCKKECENKIEEYVYYLVDSLSKKGLWTGSLFSGAAGIGLSILHLEAADTKYSKLINSLNNYISYYVKELMNKIDADEISPTDYDIIEGLSGILIYLLLQEKKELDELKYLIIQYLSDLVGETPQEIKLYVKSENQMSSEESQLYPNGCLNLGLAHGVAGVGIAISYAKIKGFYTELSIKALKNIIVLYDAFELKKDSNLVWKNGVDILELKKIAAQGEPNFMRDAWCYGSPGISLFYLYAGIALNQIDLKQKANQILKNALIRQAGIDSSILCHGYAGLLEICILFKNVLKTSDYDDSISTLAQKIRLDCGTKKLQVVTLEQKYEENLGFLDGLSGIILTLVHFHKKETKSFWRTSLLLFDDVTREV